jgi:hypothetical protein
VRPLVSLALVGAVLVLAHPTSRGALLRFAFWPMRDFVRRDWDRARAERVSPEWMRTRGLA